MKRKSQKIQTSRSDRGAAVRTPAPAPQGGRRWVAAKMVVLSKPEPIPAALKKKGSK